MAKELERKPLGAKRKLQRMGVVVGKRKIKKTTTTVPLSRDIPTHKVALKALVGARDLLRKPDQEVGVTVPSDPG